MGIENNWQKLTPNVSLEAYVGKTVKIAFYFRSILVNNYTQATLAVDNVKVGNQEIENLPVIEDTRSRFRFFEEGRRAFIPRQLYSYDYGSQKHGHENKYEWRNFVGRFVGNQSYVGRRIYFGKFRR